MGNRTYTLGKGKSAQHSCKLDRYCMLYGHAIRVYLGLHWGNPEHFEKLCGSPPIRSQFFFYCGTTSWCCSMLYCTVMFSVGCECSVVCNMCIKRKQGFTSILLYSAVADTTFYELCGSPFVGSSLLSALLLHVGYMLLHFGYMLLHVGYITNIPLAGCGWNGVSCSTRLGEEWRQLDTE